MCGILGGTNKEWNYDAGLEVMHHRGPDDKKVCYYEGMNLGFVRLAIRDLSQAAMQPMQSEDGNIVILFNGEIYGIANLRTELESKYVFKTTSDTEVILYAYLEFGKNFIHKIDGMFAIALFDKRLNSVVLYRDRVGIKPLYYLYDGQNFCFSSELKGIEKTCIGYKFEYDITALYDFFTYEYIPEPKSMYKNVYKLEPANYIIYHVDEHRLEQPERYWSLRVNGAQGRQKNAEDLHEEVRDVIQKSVKEQLVSDVNVGTFLSGGIDSSIVTAVTNQLGYNLKAFSVGFNASEKNQHYDERKYAKMLAEKYDIDLCQKVFLQSFLEENYHKAVDWYDEPFAASSCYPAYFVSKMARENDVTVILTGNGGDEIFGGYTRYYLIKKQLASHRMPNRKISDFYYYHFYLRKYKKLSEKILEDVALYALNVDWWGDSNKRRFLKQIGIEVPKDYDDFWYLRKYDNKELPPITRAQVIDFYTYLPSACLQKDDRATMQWSIEARVPLCGKEVIEFAFALSEEDRCPNNEIKGLLKHAYKDIVPEEILYKNKKGFTFPPEYGEKTVGFNNKYEYRKSIFDMVMQKRR